MEAGLTSLFIWLISDRVVYALFLGIVVFGMNWIVYPRIKDYNEMKRIFYGKLEKIPTPEEFAKEIKTQRDEMMKLLDVTLENSALRTESAIGKHILELNQFYARLTNYESWLRDLIKAIEILGGDVANSTSEIDSNIQTLLQIRTEMVRLLRSVLREADKKGYFENIDPQPLDRIQTFLDASDKHFQAMYNDHAIDRFGMPTDQKVKFNRLFSQFGEQSEEDNNNEDPSN